MNTTSQPGGIAGICRRTASRMRRRTRLRTTALPICLLTEKPNRLQARPLGRAHNTSSSSGQHLPSRRTCSKRLRSFTRWMRFTPARYPTRALPIPLAIAQGSRQLVASLQASPLHDCTAIGGAHAPAKAMHPQAPPCLRLIRPLRHAVPSSPFAANRAHPCVVRWLTLKSGGGLDALLARFSCLTQPRHYTLAQGFRQIASNRGVRPQEAVPPLWPGQASTH
jgi:hypothetical protein